MEKCSWLKDERYSKWLSADHVNKHAAFCRVCELVFLLTTMGIKAVDSHMKGEKHKKSIVTCDKKLSEESGFDSELLVGGRRQCYTGGSIVVEDIRSTFASTEMLKAELLWTLQTVAKHQSYQCVVILILLHNGLE